MANLNNLEEQKGQFILMVGDSGSGKTCAANSYPGLNYNFDFDRRIRGATAYKPLSDKIKDGNIHYDYWMKDKTYSEVASRLDSFEKKAKARRLDYKNIILSSLTSLEAFMVADSWKYTNVKTKKGEDKVRVYGNIKLPGYDQWGYEQVAFSEIIDTLKLISTLGINCIVDAHWAPEFDEKGNPVGKGIAIRPKLGKNILKDFDEVYYFEKLFVGGKDRGSTIHRCIFRNELARTSFQELPNVLDWTGKNFFECIQGYLSKGKE